MHLGVVKGLVCLRLEKWKSVSSKEIWARGLVLALTFTSHVHLRKLQFLHLQSMSDKPYLIRLLEDI